jgi:hypothetical protein
MQKRVGYELFVNFSAAWCSMLFREKSRSRQSRAAKRVQNLKSDSIKDHFNN